MRDGFKKLAVEAAVSAGTFIQSRVGRVRQLGFKSDINLVTDVDKKAEAMIVRSIRKAFPDHNILAEENSYAPSGSGYRWIIDPLDGTTNFAHGLPIFAVSIGLEKYGEIVLGVVYDPARKELFYALKGHGAYLNNKRIHVSGIGELRRAFLVTGFAYNFRESRDSNIGHFVDFLKKAQAVRRLGSAAIDLCYVACGRFEGFWELDLHPWDTAAGSLIVREAGGKITRFDGSSYRPHDKQCLATNGRVHNAMARILCKK